MCFDATGQIQTGFVAPQDTDNEIDINLNNHFFAINPSVPSKNVLVVFFPGTGGVPFVYREIIRNAAELGFHSIGLNYPNDEAVNFLCRQGTLDCHADVRLEIIDGTDRGSLVDVSRANSIENRLIKLLQYLNTERPSEDWGQFLDTGETAWTKIVVAGHSQGGGHAGILGRFRPVRRALMFAANDFSGALGMPANWISMPETTPNASTPDKFRAFSHTNDELVNFETASTISWPLFGIDRFGRLVNADDATGVLVESNSYTSTRECGNHHGCVAVDQRLVYEDGVPVYKPVWDALLENAESEVFISDVKFLRKAEVTTRPYAGQTAKRYTLQINGGGFTIGSVVRLGTVGCVVVSSSESQIVVALPAGKVGTERSRRIRVTNPDGSKSNLIYY
ncbi:MAG: hypothetical protein HKN33_09075 [Pyrinomonadaceae bacterium]|nr:hypothetical protein [Pyrinomonadaceae bacterium]